jgi:2-polyprenyl-3-methyl-5-hydroxy-6-metoxy-1,4-benzoquinol methylase
VEYGPGDAEMALDCPQTPCHDVESAIVNRDQVNRIRYVLEELLPAVLRDSAAFKALIWLYARGKTRYFTSFRERSPYMTEEEYAEYYRNFPPIMNETDLNEASIERIVKDVEGDTVLDVGCGRGFLANTLVTRRKISVTGYDFLIDATLPARYPNVTFVEGLIEKLPFPDGAFDTVTCSHTLEHIIDFSAAVRELRRVARRRLIIVVPKEREYRYSFNLHVNFFPYRHSLLNRLQPLPEDHTCEEIHGDLYYCESRLPTKDSERSLD